MSPRRKSIGDRLTAIESGLGHEAASRQASRNTHSSIPPINPGRHHAPHRVSPAHQDFEPEDLAPGDGLRLKMQFQLVPLQSKSNFSLKDSFFPNMPVHRRFKEPNRSALFCLRTIKCCFCIRDQTIHVRAVLWKNADPDGEASVDIVVVDANRRVND